MIKNILPLFLLFALILCACAPSETSTTGTTATPETQTSTQSQETTSTTIPSAEAVYNDFLARLCKRLNKIIGDDTHLDGLSTEEGMMGVAEIAGQRGIDMLERIGYTYQDLNNDGQDELLICAAGEVNEGWPAGTRILCVFTFENAEMELLLEGWNQNRIYLLDDGSVYSEGSGDTLNSSYCIYTITQDNKALCKDCYFTDVDEAGNNLYFYNTTGENDPVKTDPFDGDDETFTQRIKSIQSGVQPIDLILLGDFEA